MAAVNENLAKLQACLDAAGVSEGAKTFLTTGLGLASLADLVSYVPEASYEDRIAAVMEPKRNGDEAIAQLDLQVSRVRTAWKAAKKSLEEAVEAPAGSPAADAEADAPLPVSTIAALKARWIALYGALVFISYFQPADTLIARVFREFTRRTPQVHSLAKVKSMMAASLPTSQTRVPIGGAILTMGVEESRAPRGIVEYYFRLRILVTAFAFAGSHEVPDDSDPTKKIVFAPLAENLNYADDSLRIASQWEVSDRVALDALAEKDVLTRATMATYIRAGVSQGEALRKARAEHAVEWKTKPFGGQSSSHQGGGGGQGGGGQGNGGSGGNGQDGRGGDRRERYRSFHRGFREGTFQFRRSARWKSSTTSRTSRAAEGNDDEARQRSKRHLRQRRRKRSRCQCLCRRSR